MTKIGSILLFLFMAVQAHAQIKFESGYIVSETGEKTVCLIENKDWVNNPEHIDYKLSETDKARRATVREIREFKVDGYSKFIRATVKIDTSHNAQSISASTSRLPEWTTKTVFLKVMVDAPASLYFHESAGQFRFFFKKAGDSTIQQLVYKEYSISTSTIGKNYQYRQQLYSDVRCGTTFDMYLKKIRYGSKELKDYFISYNSRCMGYTAEETKTKIANVVERDFLSLRITSGLAYTGLSISSAVSPTYEMTFDKEFFFRASLEIEYILPFNKNKWSVFLDPAYVNSTANKTNKANYEARIQYKAIEFPIGLRHYFFLGDNRRIFLNAIYVPGVVKQFSDSKVTYVANGQETKLEIAPRDTFGFGAGLSWGPVSLEARYYLPQNLLGKYLYLTSSYDRLSIIAGYRFVRLKTNPAN